MSELNGWDEIALWEACFPCTLNYCRIRGVYSPRSERALLSEMLRGTGLGFAPNEAVMRLEMACTQLWVRLDELFACDVFPHLLACATDLLRAADFGEDDDGLLAELAKELALALVALEYALAMPEAVNQQAAESPPAADERPPVAAEVSPVI